MTHTIDLLDPVLSDLVVVIRGTDGTDHGATPCSDLDVEGLRHHVAGWLSTFADGFADPDGQAPEGGADAPRPAAQAADFAADAADRLSHAVRAGADQRPLYLGENAMPGDMALSMILWEYVVHGWDLATATGQSWSPSDAAVEASLAFAPGMLTPDFQGEGKAFGPPVDVPGDAPALDRLVGLSGRDPSWRPNR